MTKRVSVTAHYINSGPSVQAWMAFCCAFPAFLLPMAGKQGPSSRSPTGLLLRRDRQQGEDLLEVEPLVCRVLVNFLPDGDNGSYKWYKHDWQFEADYYRKHEVPIRVLF